MVEKASSRVLAERNHLEEDNSRSGKLLKSKTRIQVFLGLKVARTSQK